MQSRLDGLTHDQQHLRHFLGTYERTTLAVGKAVDDGFFEDPAWVEGWDVAFARALRGRPRPPPGRRFAVAPVAARLRRTVRTAAAAPRAARHQRPRELRPAAGAARGDLRRRTSPTRCCWRDVVATTSASTGCSPAGSRPRTTELASHGRSLTDRVLQPLNRVASRRFLRESRHEGLAQHRRAPGRPARRPPIVRRTAGRAGGAQRRADRRPARPRSGAAPAGGRRLRRRAAAAGVGADGEQVSAGRGSAGAGPGRPG